MPWMRSLLVVCLCSPVTFAGDWPQWLGPDRDNSTRETVAPWKETPKVVWHQPAGEGNSCPVVAAGRVFLHEKVKDQDAEEVVAFDAKTGKEQWRTRYPRAMFQSLFGNGPRATPAVVGDRVYTYGITGVLSSFEAATGKQVWQVDALKTVNAKNLFFGASCSPLVEGDNVLVNVGGKEAAVAAFDKGSGEVRWKALNDGASYASPIAFGQGAERQVVFLTQEALVSLRPSDGHPFWRFPMKDRLFESSTTPVRAGDLVVASSITYGSVALRLETADGKPGYKQAWKEPALTSYFSTPVVVGDFLYIITGKVPGGFRQQPEASLHCVELKTGKEQWKKAKVGQYHAALMRTGDDKVLMLDDGGHLILLDPNPKEYRELARSKVCGETWAHPALADGKLYVRDNRGIICLQLGS